MTTATSIATPSSSRPRARRKVAKKKVAKKSESVMLPSQLKEAPQKIKAFCEAFARFQVEQYIMELNSYFNSIECYANREKSRLIRILKTEKAITKLMLSATNTTRLDIKSYLSTINSTKEDVLRNISTTISLQDVTKAFLYLVNTYDNVTLRNDTLTVMTEEIVLKHSEERKISLGQFNIHLHLKEFRYGNVSQVFKCRAVTPKTYDGYEHPNIRSGLWRLCCGDGKEAVKTSLVQGRIGDFVDIVQQILKTDSDHPYRGISSWYVP